MEDLYKLHAWQVIELLRKGKISAYELTNSIFSRIEERKEINAYITLCRGYALREAREIDERYKRGEISPNMLIAGIPVAIKDNICFKGFPTTCGSRILENFIAPYDAFVVEKILEHGGIIIGKTNMDEFAMGSSNETSYFGPVLNPHDPERIPGGSSGGSAAAVADNQTILSLGSDTGGSIRQPASLCGVVGLKPTYGRVSRFGLVAFASSLDQIGCITKDVKDSAILLQVIAGYDKKDSTSVPVGVDDYISELDKIDIKKFKFAYPKEYFIEGIDPEVKENVINVLKILEKEGCIVDEVSLPHTEYAVADYYIIAPSEASSNLSRFDGVKYGFRSHQSGMIEMYKKTRGEGFGDEVKRRILLGTYALSAGYYDAYYLKALKVRTLIKQDFEKVFKDYDFIITPTSPTPAFKIGEKISDPLQMYLSDIFTISANLAGIPGISIPTGKTKSGLPIGTQILARHFDEKRLLQSAYAIEQLIKEK